MKRDASGSRRVVGSLRRILGALALALGVAAAVTSCGGNTSSPRAGGESHFLNYCDAGCGPELSCVAGVCTRSCLVGQSSCADLATGAECTDRSIEPGAVAVCDLACTADRDCAALSSTHRCVSGFCRGGEPAGGTPTSCRVAHQTYPSGSTEIPPPEGCGACTCTNGALTCTEEPCSELGVPLVLCPKEDPNVPLSASQIRTDPVDVLSAALVGGSVTFEVGHGGGCARHDYALCFDPQSRASYPEQFTVALIHDAHDDGCNAYVQKTLKFDLTKIAETHMRGNRTDGGLVSTPFGLYAFGEAKCEERTRAALDQMQRAADRADRQCSTSADCAFVYPSTHCSAMCAIPVSQTAAAEILGAIDTVNAQICDVGAGCTTTNEAPCGPPTPVQCVDGQCVF